MANIQWYPGHMAKTMRALREELSLCDTVLELCDARAPLSSRNPRLAEAIGEKKRILLLGKADLADPQATQAWLDAFHAQGLAAYALDSRQMSRARQLQTILVEDHQEIIARARARGRLTRPIRLIVAGIPNVGKSTLINSLLGRRKAQTANRPGVTRSFQWLKAGTTLELLDSPGLLWPKLDTRQAQIVLGAIAAIKDDIMPLEELAGELLLHLQSRYPQLLSERLQVDLPSPESCSALSWQEQANACLAAYARRYAFLLQGGTADLARSARHILKSFREGSWGRLSLEIPENEMALPDAPRAKIEETLPDEL